MTKFKFYYRTKYRFWGAVATIGHTLFRLGQWRSFDAYDKMGGRRRKTTRPVKIALDFVRGIMYNIYVAIRVAIKKLK